MSEPTVLRRLLRMIRDYQDLQARLGYPRNMWAPEAIYIGDEYYELRNDRDSYSCFGYDPAGEETLAGIPIIRVNRTNHLRVC